MQVITQRTVTLRTVTPHTVTLRTGAAARAISSPVAAA